MVFEADESDGSLQWLYSHLAILTNLTDDHLAAYDGSISKLQAAILQFLQNVHFRGHVVVNLDDPGARQLIPQIRRQVVTFGKETTADFVYSYRQDADAGVSFRISSDKYGIEQSISMSQIGEHIVKNATAAFIAAYLSGLNLEQIAAGLASYKGSYRRLDKYVLPTPDGEQLLFDDYGHHPKELLTVYEAICAAHPNKKMLWCFQPHRYSRTKQKLEEFVRVLSYADGLILLPTYEAGEIKDSEYNSVFLMKHIHKQHPQADIYYAESLEQVAEALLKYQNQDYILVFQGAGNIGSLCSQYIAQRGGKKHAN